MTVNADSLESHSIYTFALVICLEWKCYGIDEEREIPFLSRVTKAGNSNYR